MSDRSKRHSDVVSRYGVDAIGIGKLECSSEQIAFELERGLIKCFLAAGTNLVNKTSGGDGCKTIYMTQEVKDKLKAADKSYMKSTEYRRSLSKALSGRTLSKAHCEKLSMALRERYADSSARKAHSERMREVLANPEVREKLSAAHSGLKHTQTAREKMSESAKRRFADPKQREILSAAAAVRWAKRKKTHEASK